MNFQQSQFREIQKVLTQTNDQIWLMNLFQQSQDIVTRIMILSRLKHILIQIPNDIYTPPQYLKQCNDRYFYFILNHITQSTQRSSNINDSQKRHSQIMKLMFYVVSLRIKLWFEKREFQDVFSSLVINIQHNRKMIPMVVEFFVQLVEVFEDRAIGATGQEEINNNNKDIDMKSYQKTFNSTNKLLDRQSLTRKTNNSLFIDDKITRKTQRATKQLHQTIKNKSCFRKQNKFQRQFFNTELNKLLIFANQCFNRAVVQNPRYDYQQQSTDQQQQPAYFIKMPIHHITKILSLIHKILMFDYFGDRQRNQQDEYFTQKMPQIIPTKNNKYSRFQEIQNWIKNKTDAYKYQYIYFYSNDIELKVMIVRLFGDLLRIHQKFFKKEIIFKVHLETVLMLLKNMLENLQVRYNEQYELAIVFGQCTNKILLNSTFPTFLNLTKPQFKKDLIQAIEHFIQKQILDLGLIDVRLVKYHFGFFVELLEKLNINSSLHFRVKDFKQDVEVLVRRLGDNYEETMYQSLQRESHKRKFIRFMNIDDTVRQLNSDNFQTFFSIFRFYQPKRTYDKDFTIGEKSLWICSRVQSNFYQYDRMMRYTNTYSQKDSKVIKKIDLIRRHCLQCFAKFIEVMQSSSQQQQNNRRYREQEQQDMLTVYRYKVMTAIFVCERLINSKNNILLLFDESNYLFAFTKSVITIYTDIKNMLTEFGEQSKFSFQQFSHNPQTIQLRHDLITLNHHSTLLLNLVTKLNQQLFQQKRKANMMLQEMRHLDMRIMTGSKKSGYGQRRKMDEGSRKDDDEMEESLKLQCENVQHELLYFQGIVKMIAEEFSEDDDRINNLTSQNKDTEQQTRKLQNTTMKQALHAIIKNKQYTTSLYPLYRLYFLSLFKMQLHRKKHFTNVRTKHNKQTTHETRQNKPTLRMSQQSYYSQQQQYKNDDQCSVIEEQQQICQNDNESKQHIQSNIINQHKCHMNLQKHNNIKHFMNVIGYSVYLQLVIGDEQIKQQLQMRFMQWFQMVIGNGDSSKDNLLMNNINSKNSRSNDNNDKNNKSESGESNIYLQSCINDAHGEFNNCNKNLSNNKLKSYLQIYSLQSLMMNLVNQQYPVISQQQRKHHNNIQQNNTTNQNNSNQNTYTTISTLNLTTMLLKLFRHTKYQIQIKKHVLSAVIEFVQYNFQEIIKSNYSLERVRDDQQIHEDQLMAARVEVMVSMLESMVNLYFMQFRINVFNVQFLTMFDYHNNKEENNNNNNNYLQHQQPQQHHFNNNNHKTTPLHYIQQSQITNLLTNTQTISSLFTKVIQFILKFPQHCIENGFYSNIQTQLIRLIRQVYYQFSQFTTIFMFELDMGREEVVERLGQMGLVKVLCGYQNDSDNQDNDKNVTQHNRHKPPFTSSTTTNNYNQKYAITITLNNLPYVINAYTMLIKYIQKVIWLSYIAHQSKQWLMIRNRQILPYLKQVYQFLYQMVEWERRRLTIEGLQQTNYFMKEVKHDFYHNLIKLFNTLFQFIKYFLINFQTLTLTFVTEHLSLIENIYQLIEMGRKVEDREVKDEVDKWVEEMNKFIVFRSIPQHHNQKVNQQQSKSSKKTPSSKNSHYNNNNNINIQQQHHQQDLHHQLTQYTGWKYIQKLYLSSSTDILEQIQSYQIKYKHSVSQISKPSSTSLTSMSQQNTNFQLSQHQHCQQKTITNEHNQNNLQQSQQLTQYFQQQQQKRQQQKKRNSLVMSSLKKIRPVLVESESVNMRMKQWEELGEQMMKQQQEQEVMRRLEQRRNHQQHKQWVQGQQRVNNICADNNNNNNHQQITNNTYHQQHYQQHQQKHSHNNNQQNNHSNKVVNNNNQKQYYQLQLQQQKQHHNDDNKSLLSNINDNDNNNNKDNHNDNKNNSPIKILSLSQQQQDSSQHQQQSIGQSHHQITSNLNQKMVMKQQKQQQQPNQNQYYYQQQQHPRLSTILQQQLRESLLYQSTTKSQFPTQKNVKFHPVQSKDKQQNKLSNYYYNKNLNNDTPKRNCQQYDKQLTK